MQRLISIFETLLFGNSVKRMKVGSIGALMAFLPWGGRSGLSGL